MTGLVERAIKEVVDRHNAFAAWFTGRGDDALFEEMRSVFAPSFVLISPDGSSASHEAVIAMLEGGRSRRPDSFSIKITDAKALWSSKDAALIAYLEHQAIHGEWTLRQSTALFTPADGTPNGVVWQHVHETWINEAHIKEGVTL
ncbi:MAG: hypothetical protein AAGB11_04985 [Pseudomonadota bacterium]